MTLIKYFSGASQVTHIYEIDKHNNAIFVVIRNNSPEMVRKLEYKADEEFVRRQIIRRGYDIYNNFKTKLGVII